jgi:hypothetical protein
LTPASAATCTKAGSSSTVSFPLLQRAKRAHIADDAVEIVAATNHLEACTVRGIERHAQLIKAGIDQCTAIALAEHGAVGVEQDMDAAVLQIAHHARQVRDQHRFADAVQNGARKIGRLIDDGSEQTPVHIRRRLELFVGARTGGAEQIAAVGDLQIEADRRTLRHRRTLGRDLLVIAARIKRRAHGWRFVGNAHCDNPAFAAFDWRLVQATQTQASNRPPNRTDFVTILGM